MSLAIWQQTIVDESGDLLPGATVTVRRETPGQPLAPIKADRAGDTAKENPFTADATTAEALFYAVGGAYKIEITSGAFSKTLRYVAIGRGAEADITGLTPKGDWASGTTYDTGDLVTHSGRTFASNEDSNLANTPPTSDASDTHWTWIPATSVTGGVVGNRFASVYAGSPQTVTVNTWTKVEMSAELEDGDSVFDATTNHRYQPTEAGWYLCIASVSANTDDGGLAGARLYKNGVGINLQTFVSGGDFPATPAVHALVHLNGSTDYIEVFGYSSDVENPRFNQGESQTYFQAWRMF